jgi:hypothetical protein
MGTEKERLRKWREKNRAQGRKSFTVMLSREAQSILNDEKESTGKSYSAIIESAVVKLKAPVQKVLLAGKGHIERSETGVTRNVTSNAVGEKVKLLIDDEMAQGDFGAKISYEGAKIADDGDSLREGLIPRLLKKSKSRFYRLKK